MDAKVPILSKIVLLSSGYPGKTSYINRLVSNQYFDSIPATVGIAFKNIEVSYGNQTYTGQFWDTAAHERFLPMAKMYLRDCQLVVIFVPSNGSKDNLIDKVKSVVSTYSLKLDNIHYVIMGTKTDLPNAISKEIGREIAQETGAVAYFGCSAKTGTDVKQSGFEIVLIGAFLKLLQAANYTAAEELVRGAWQQDSLTTRFFNRKLQEVRDSERHTPVKSPLTQQAITSTKEESILSLLAAVIKIIFSVNKREVKRTSSLSSPRFASSPSSTHLQTRRALNASIMSSSSSSSSSSIFDTTQRTLIFTKIPLLQASSSSSNLSLAQPASSSSALTPRKTYADRLNDAFAILKKAGKHEKVEKYEKEIRENIGMICPITKLIMTEPYLCVIDQQAYEYAAILQVLANGAKSPINRELFTISDLHPNKPLQLVIEYFVKKVESVADKCKDHKSSADQEADQKPPGKTNS